MGLSRTVTAFLNCIIMLVGGAVLGIGLWMKFSHGGSECVQFLQWPVIITGAVILIVSLMGFVGAVNGVSILLWCNLFVMFLVMVVLVAFTVFAFIVTNSKAGEVVSGRGYKEYKLGDYSHWLQKQVNGTKNWNHIRDCIFDLKTCKKMNKYDNYAALIVAKLNPVQSGCCIPPSECGFTYGLNATNWVAPASPVSNNTDCSAYSNNNTISTGLCFNCNSCKAGVLKEVKDDWKIVSVVCACAFAVLLVVYTVGCCAYRSARREEYGGFRKGFA